MTNKTIILFAFIIITISSAQAVNAETIRGLVTQVSPSYSNYTHKTPYQHCQNQQVNIHNVPSSKTPLITGGILGGLIGNQFGKGDGKTILTVAGVLLGSSIGSDVSQSNHGHIKNIQHCETRYSESVKSKIRGYNISVTVPNGNIISTYKETPYNPPPIHSKINVYINYRLGNY